MTTAVAVLALGVAILAVSIAIGNAARGGRIPEPAEAAELHAALAQATLVILTQRLS